MAVQLKAQLADTVEKSQLSALDVFLLYDTSGSVSDADFLKAKQAGEKLTATFSDGTTVGFGQFASTFKLESPLSSDLDDIQALHRSMTRLSGSTETALALERTTEQMAQAEGDIHQVYLFTDGAPNNQGDAVRAATKLRHTKNTELFCVGIGSVQQANLNEMCGADKVFLLQRWSDLINAIPANGISGDSSTGSTYEIGDRAPATTGNWTMAMMGLVMLARGLFG